ncbi:MAG: lysophospholipid acyltransferase family protein [Caldicoprobacterales bacterium]|nr:1-acyl-sn-glycerol-3-phosphate acyltransferase [Clostridiales bacterium]
MKGHLRHKIIYRTLQILMKPFLVWKFNYNFERIKPLKHPAFILPNHVTNWDPLLVGLSFPQMMYYVASDHLFRLGWVGKIIQFLVAPIPRVKSAADRETVVSIFKHIREGHNICIFPEGNMTFGGETGELHGTTARLVKRTGAALVTYRMEGGYLTQPRWSRYPRRGSMTGYPVRIYNPEEIKGMSEEELMKCIEHDLYTNAYDEQKRRGPVAFRGKNLAENLETALYLCPCCGKMEGLQSRGDYFFCSCGLKLRYTEYGLLKSINQQKPPFTTVLEWLRWQSRRVRELAEELRNRSENQAITSDEKQSLWKIQRAKKARLLGRGRLQLFKDRLAFQSARGSNYSFPLSQISDISIHGQRTLIFTTTSQEYYELKSQVPRSALKYYELCKALTGKHNIYQGKE